MVPYDPKTDEPGGDEKINTGVRWCGRHHAQAHNIVFDFSSPTTREMSQIEGMIAMSLTLISQKSKLLNPEKMGSSSRYGITMSRNQEQAGPHCVDRLSRRNNEPIWRCHNKVVVLPVDGER